MRNNLEENVSLSDIVFDVFNMVESVIVKLDCIMECFEMFFFIENCLDSLVFMMVNIEFIFSRFDVDVMMFKEGVGKREKRIIELEILINYNEDDVVEL